MAARNATEESPKARRPSYWHLPLWWANALSVLVLLATYLAPHLSPKHYWLLALLAMTYPFQLLLHLGFLGWWAVFRRKRMLLSAVALLLGWGHVGDHVQLLGRSEPTEAVAGQGVKVMSFNVRVFDLYNWTGNKKSRDAIFALFEKEQPDILCLQEFFQSSNKRFFRTSAALKEDLGMINSHVRYSQEARYDQHFGIATFSRLPIVAKGHITFTENPNNQCIWSDIVMEGDTIRVYNAHLASYHFGDEDYKFLAALDTDTHADTLKLGGRRILKRLRGGIRQRADEVAKIAEHMGRSPHPVVYCGDMNDVPMSYGYAMLREQLDDAFVESGQGMGGTYIGKLPSFRIDHILHSEALESWNFTTHPEELSDHHAISCVLAPRQ